MAHTHEAFWQHMKQPAAYEFERFEGLHPVAPCFPILVSQANATLLIVAKQALFSKRRLFHIRSEVTHGLTTGAHMAHVTDPFCTPAVRWHLREERGKLRLQ